QDNVNPEDRVRKIVHGRRLPQFAATSKLRISPGSHSATTSKGRQHTSQSVVNRWLGTLVSTTSSNACPQNGHWIFPETSIWQSGPATANRKKVFRPRLEPFRAGLRDGVALRAGFSHEFVIVAERDEQHQVRETQAAFRADAGHAVAAVRRRAAVG